MLEGLRPSNTLYNVFGALPLLDTPKARELKRGEYGAPAKTKFLWGKKPLLIKYSPLPPRGRG